MSPKKRIFILIGVVVGLVLAFVLFILYIRNQESNFIPAFVNRVVPNRQVQTSQEPTPAAPVSPSIPTPPAAAQPTNPEDTYLKQLARLFVERIGSYSNQNENQHIDDMLPLATPRMAQYLESLRIDQQREYAGATTRVVTLTLRSRDSQRAVVDIGVQQEIKTNTSSRREYRTGRVELLQMEDGVWKVDGVFWNES